MYQSNGMGTAPSQAPTQAPKAPPQTASAGRANAQTCFQTLLSTPWTYTSGVTVSRAICAAHSTVCAVCVVKGAPKRMRRRDRTGVPRRKVNVRAMNVAYSGQYNPEKV